MKPEIKTSIVYKGSVPMVKVEALLPYEPKKTVSNKETKAGVVTREYVSIFSLPENKRSVPVKVQGLDPKAFNDVSGAVTPEFNLTLNIGAYVNETTKSSTKTSVKRDLALKALIAPKAKSETVSE